VFRGLQVVLEVVGAAHRPGARCGPPPGPAGEGLLSNKPAPQHFARPQGAESVEAAGGRSCSSSSRLGNAQLYCLRRSFGYAAQQAVWVGVAGHAVDG